MRGLRVVPTVALIMILSPNLVTAQPESTSTALGDWICVPGENGRWRCASGGREPAAESLPDPTPSTVPDPIPDSGDDGIFLRPNAGNDNPQDASAPLMTPQARSAASSASSGAARFSLQMASVNALEDVERFVRDFELDPALARYAIIDDRFVIFWGAFISPQQAQMAAATLPPAIRAIQPQLVPLARLDAPLIALDSTAAAGTGPTIATRSKPEATPTPARVVEAPTQAIPLAPQSLAGEPAENTDPTPESVGSPTGTGEARARVATASADEPSAQSPVASIAERTIAETSTDVEANETPVESPASEPLADTAPDRNRREALSSSNDEAPSPPPTPADAPEIVDEAAAAPEPVVAMATDQPEPEDRVSPARPETRPTTTPAPPPRQVSAPRSGFVSSFAGFEPDWMTVQLSSQKSLPLADFFVRKHGLDASLIHRVRIDEGAGPRWLVLLGSFPSMVEAEAAMSRIPSDIRSPWARRIGPIQQGMLESR